MTDSKIKKIMGVRIDDVTKEEAMEVVTGWLRDAGAAQHDTKKSHSGRSPESSKLIFTPNPEFLMIARKDLEFKKILNSSDLNIPDGVGLQLFGGIKNRIPGVDFMISLCALAQKDKLTIGLLGGQEGIAKKTAEKLMEMFPDLKVTFAIDGQEADRLIEDYDALRYVDILFVALGAPRQEKYLASFRPSPESSRKIAKDAGAAQHDVPFGVGVGVGGSFDYISGNISRAPKFLQDIGLEWLYRFILQPKRIIRFIKRISP